jgi:hypothetical protein
MRIRRHSRPPRSNIAIPTARVKPFRRDCGDDQGLNRHVRLVVACLEAERKARSFPMIGAELDTIQWKRPRGKRVNQPDSGQTVVRTP